MIFQYGLMSLCMHGVVAVIAAVFFQCQVVLIQKERVMMKTRQDH